MYENIKILFVGDDTYEMYAKAFEKSFLELGYYNTKLFAVNSTVNMDSSIKKLCYRIQNNIAIGPKIREINNELLSYVREYSPQLVFFYTVRLIYPSTIKKIHQMGIKVFMYNNDNPFADYYPKYFWRHYRNGLKYADVGFVYRTQNIEDYKKSGCEKVEILRSYYIKSRNYCLDENHLDVPEVVFIGHNEEDERKSYIKSLLDAHIKVGIVKNGWENFEVGNPYLVKLEDTQKLYNEILNAAKIAIVFLSKINKDTYTRRCFEIPAVKTMMLSVYTEDLASMFEPDKEAVYFKTKEEFVKKVKLYLENDSEREKIALAGYERLMKDGHEVKDRALQIIKVYEETKRVLPKTN